MQLEQPENTHLVASGSNTVNYHNALINADDLDAIRNRIVMNSNSAKIALMANLSRNGSDALTDVHNPDNLNYDLFNQRSNEQFDEIVRLKQNLFEQVQEKDCLMKTVSELKNELKLEENRNIDREIALEKKIKQLDNIIFKKARESKPKLYDGNTILKMDPIVVPDSDETIELTTSVPALDPSHSSTTVIVEVPKELPTVSMVNTSLKELKRYLTGFDQVVKERTTATAITEGTWGFEHTKACFRDEIIPFIKNLKDIFNNFNRYLVEELADVQKVFYQMEQAVEQHRLKSRTFEIKMNQVLSENERLLAQAIDKDIVKTVVNLSVNANGENVTECQKCLELETELVKKKDFVDKETYDNLCKCFTTLEKHCITLEADSQLNQEIFQQENSVLNQNAPSFTQLFELSELKAQSQAKDTVIVKLKEQIKSFKGNVEDSSVEAHPRNVKSSLNKKNGNVNVHGSAVVQNLKKQDNSDYVCIQRDDCMPSDNLLFGKPKGKVFTQIGYIWRPTGRTFTIVGNACPLTRITTTNEVPSRKPIVLDSESIQTVGNPVNPGDPTNTKFHLLTLNGMRLSKSSSVKFGNDQVAKIMGFGDYQIGNVTISRVYYVEGLGHNLFSVGQLCDSNLEVAFRQHTCFIRNLEGVDLLTEISRWNKLFTLLSGEYVMASSPICLFKASKNKSWLWHRRISHLYFGSINHMARHGLVRVLPKLQV
ncbi:retrovirus-related pol polyprotein from transposon TNT 1-94 [Tanacetum coccineum]|uniref:Retrovirus-related pol polyprotein from transposon TNT 1-94 n=1 Tax=Tanacetum coccineum TaxID=301880 RepID=A0ABQ4XXZ3_9ASTR